MEKQMPAFYVAYTNQQMDLRTCYKPPQAQMLTQQGKDAYARLSPGGKANVDQIMYEMENGGMARPMPETWIGRSPGHILPNIGPYYLSRTIIKADNYMSK